MGRRKKDTSSTTNKIYFTKETQDAIIKYNNSSDSDERDAIFREHIEYPFDKLAENIINRFKFPYVNHSFEDTKKQVVSFLCIHLSKYTEDKGKAFSYFSVIAKNYLILHNNNGYKNEKRSVYLSDEIENEVPIEEILQLEVSDPELQEDAQEFIKLLIEYWDNNITRIFKKKRDIEIASAVIEMFRRVDNIENFNKKAVYLMIREMTNCKTSYITKVINKMKRHVDKQLNNYREYGIIDPKESKLFIYQ